MTRSHSSSSRRTVLKAAAVAGALGVVGTRGRAQETTTIELGGDTGGWIGRSPESIAETRNPTLELEPGQTYEIVWENVDGARHNVVILGEGGERLVRTELIAEEGATQSVEFEATEGMTEYLCEAHPSTMVGDVEVGGTGGQQGNQTATTTEEAGAGNQTTTAEDGAGNQTATEETTGTEQGGPEGEETEVPEARDPDEAQEGTPQADPEVNQDALAEFQDGNATDGGDNQTTLDGNQTTLNGNQTTVAGNGTDAEETEVPEARDPDEAQEGTPQAEPEVPGGEIDPDEIDVRVVVGGERNATETEQGARGAPSVDRSGFGTLGVLGGLASAGAFLLSRDDDEE